MLQTRKSRSNEWMYENLIFLSARTNRALATYFGYIFPPHLPSEWSVCVGLAHDRLLQLPTTTYYILSIIQQTRLEYISRLDRVLDFKTFQSYTPPIFILHKARCVGLQPSSFDLFRYQFLQSFFCSRIREGNEGEKTGTFTEGLSLHPANKASEHAQQTWNMEHDQDERCYDILSSSQEKPLFLFYTKQYFYQFFLLDIPYCRARAFSIRGRVCPQDPRSFEIGQRGAEDFTIAAIGLVAAFRF